MLPKMPGTYGTFVAVPLYLLLRLLSPVWYFLFILLFSLFAVVIAGKAETCLGQKDPQKIVIDEIAGFFATLFLIPFSIKWMALGFLIFRFFDILKPFPIRKLEKSLPNGWGVVGDDIMAGVYANLVLQALTRLF